MEALSRVRSLRIAIVGAGSAGVLSALMLQRRGHQVSIFERAKRPRADGCGILLLSRGIQALIDAEIPGLAEGMINAGAIARRFHFRNSKGETTNISETDPSDEPPGLLIHRSAILQQLVGHLDEGSFIGDSDIRQCEQCDRHVSLTMADGSQWQGDLLIGADGIFSTVAKAVAPERRLNFLGDRVWRGVVDDPSGFCQPGDFFIYMRGRGIYANFFHIGVNADGVPQTHWGFFTEEDLPRQREQQRQLLNQPIPDQALARLCPKAAAVILSTPPAQLVANWSFDIDPLPRLSDGRMVLIGDAAHAMSPSQGCGMATGFEDAVELCHALDSSSHPDPRVALKTFDASRRPQVHRDQACSRDVSATTGRVRPVVQQHNIDLLP